MYRIQVGKWNFRYIVGAHSVGIVSPTRKKHTAPIGAVQAFETADSDRTPNGMHDRRVSVQAIASYIVANKLQ